MNLAVYHALDDAALAALASKGLLRRARKDLERMPPELTARSAEAVILAFPEENITVTLPPGGPQQATCTCPAEGVCRHILVAVLFVPRLPAAAPDATPASAAAAPTAEAPDSAPPAAPLHLTEADLIAWAGRSLYRQAVADIADDLDVTITETDQMILFAFVQRNITTRWIVDAGLPGMLCSCKRAAPCRHRVAAVLLYQAHHGQPLPAIEARVLTAAAGAPRSRAEVLGSVQATLVDLVSLGITRLAHTTRDRLQTLAISAHGVDLPRLERMLRTLADQADWYLTRDVRASATTLLITAAQTYALAHALQHAALPLPADLVGEHRSRYFPVGTLDLVGLGAQQWRTRSGYAGLSLFFWDISAGRWATWSESRPAFYEQVRFDPARRYLQPGPWDESPALTQLCRSQIRLSNARRSRAGRLSASAETRLLLSDTSDPTALDLSSVRFDDWHALAQHLIAVSPTGLRAYNSLDHLVIVTPARWGDPLYDQARQALLRPLFDASGRMLLLTLPHHTDWPFAVDTIQQWQPQQWHVWGILGQGRITGSGLELLPITLFTHEPLPMFDNTCILNLTLDLSLPGGAESSAVGNPTPTLVDELPDEVDDNEPADSADPINLAEPSPVGQLLAAVLTVLTYLAEQGMSGIPSSTGEQLDTYRNNLRQIGLTTCANALTRLVDALSAGRHQMRPDQQHMAHIVLRATSVLHLARDQLPPVMVSRLILDQRSLEE